MRLAIEYLNEEAAVEIITLDVSNGEVHKNVSLSYTNGFAEPGRDQIYFCVEKDTEDLATPGMRKVWYHQIGSITVEDAADAYEMIEDLIANDQIGELFHHLVTEFNPLTP